VNFLFRFVATNAVSLAQAHFHPEAWYRLIHAGATPVGFVMLEDWTALPDRAPDDWKADPYVYLWRFMIDQRYQRQGFGARALLWLIDHARRRPGAKCSPPRLGEAAGRPEPSPPQLRVQPPRQRGQRRPMPRAHAGEQERVPRRRIRGRRQQEPAF